MTAAWVLLLVLAAAAATTHADSTDYNVVNDDGSFKFGLSNNDVGGHYHSAVGTSNQVVRGRYGARSPVTNQLEQITYSAGPRGFRARGANIHRNMDLSQVPRGGPKGSPEDPLADPFDDPSYGFRFRTADYQRREDADRAGRVNGLYSYLDDVGERHSVRYAAGAGTGYQVTNAVPDTPSLVKYSAPLYKSSRNARGKVSYERGPGGQYKFIASAPDQRRSESTGADGITRGSYSYLDDKGLQRTVEYIAGAGIGYKIVQSSTGPGSHLNARPAIPQFGASSSSNDITDAEGSGFKRTESGSFGSRRTGQGGSSGGQSGFGSSSGFGSTAGGSGSRAGSGAFGGGGGGGSAEKGSAAGFGAGNRGSAAGTGAGSFGSGNKAPTGSGSSESHRATGAGSGSYGGGQSSGESSRGGANRYGSGAEAYGGSADGFGSAPGSQAGSGPGRYGGAGGSAEAQSGIGQGSGSGGDYSASSSERDHLHSSGNRQSSAAGASSGGSRPSSGGLAGSSSGRGSTGVRTGSAAAGSGGGSSYVTSNDASLSIDRNRDWTTTGRDSTIVKNVGKWYVGLPPGSAVRAHVQNIDLLPIGGRPPSPSEALRKDVQRSRHFDSYDD